MTTYMLLLLPLCGMCIPNAAGVPLPRRWGRQESHLLSPEVIENDDCTDEFCSAASIWKKQEQQ
jgi:hypothetical protein